MRVTERKFRLDEQRDLYRSPQCRAGHQRKPWKYSIDAEKLGEESRVIDLAHIVVAIKRRGDRTPRRVEKKAQNRDQYCGYFTPGRFSSEALWSGKDRSLDRRDEQSARGSVGAVGSYIAGIADISKTVISYFCSPLP